MTTIAACRAELVAAQATLTLVAYPTAPPEPEYPCSIVGPISDLEYLRRASGDLRYVDFVVTVYANAAATSDAAAQRVLDDFIDPTGLPAAIRSHDGSAVWREAVPLRAVSPRERIVTDPDGNTLAVIRSQDVIVRVIPNPTP